MKYKLRVASNQDLAEITNLICTCSKKFIINDFPPEGVQSYMDSHSLEKMQERIEKFHYHVMENESGKIIGIVGMQPPSHLYHLHVAPEFHKMGLGRKLWDVAMEDALYRDELKRFTVNSSTYAVPFYKKLGFKPSSQETKNGVNYVPMIKELHI